MTVGSRARWPAVVLAMLLPLVFVGPVPPAGAHEPEAQRQFSPAHINGCCGRGHGPDGEGETNEAQYISDRFDGVDREFTLRAVATPEARYYEWWRCEEIGDRGYDASRCTVIARDTTPLLSNAPPGIGTVAVFEADIDISFEGDRLLATHACIEGPPVNLQHCKDDALRVHWDDAETASVHVPTTAGHIVQPVHGAAVPSTGFTAVAFTSDDDIGRIQFCLDEGTSPTQQEDTRFGQGCDLGPASRDTRPNDSPACTSVPAGAKCWELFIDPPDDAEFALGIIEQDHRGTVESGSGDCEGDTTIGGDGENSGDDCQLDKIYLTSLSSLAPEPAPGPAASVLGIQQAACPGFAGDTRNQVTGTGGLDRLVGSPGPDILCGLGGKDVVRGLGGKDVLLGGPGADALKGGAGRDLLKAGGGRDGLDGGPGRDRCRGGPGRDRTRRCEK